jgi:hypothetical protein
MMGLAVTKTGESVTAGDCVLFGEDVVLCAIASPALLTVAVAAITATIIFLILIFIYIRIRLRRRKQVIQRVTTYIYLQERLITKLGNVMKNVNKEARGNIKQRNKFRNVTYGRM